MQEWTNIEELQVYNNFFIPGNKLLLDFEFVDLNWLNFKWLFPKDWVFSSGWLLSESFNNILFTAFCEELLELIRWDFLILTPTSDWCSWSDLNLRCCDVWNLIFLFNTGDRISERLFRFNWALEEAGLSNLSNQPIFLFS